jgi:hypothetical protein
VTGYTETYAYGVYATLGSYPISICSSSDAGSGSSDASTDAGVPPLDATTPPEDASSPIGDSYAPLPPQPGDASYTAIYAVYQGSSAVFRPLFSQPSCAVVPPYGESYVVEFTPPDAGPSGTFRACYYSTAPPCYQPGLDPGAGPITEEFVTRGVYTLTAFDDAGIATGAMDTTEGIVPLVVKTCLP